MKLSDPVKISYRNMMGAKMRSFLTILGIVIGVASVIVIMAIGQSAQFLIIDQLKGMGSNLVGVFPGASDEKGPPAAVMGITIDTLKYEDMLAFRDEKRVPEVDSAAAYVMGTATIDRGNTSYNASFVGTTASYIEVENAEVETGRFFTEEEERNLSRVVALGSKIAVELFNGEDPIGQKIKIKDQAYNVIGVFKERGAMAFGMSSQDDSVYVPLKTGQKLIMGINHIGFARVKVKNADLIPSAIENIEMTIRERHGIKDSSKDDFSVRDQAAAIKMIASVTDVLRYFLLAVGAMSLVVGGVGIMNIMLIAVNQRIREVGLRKAVGAKIKDILFQFILESASISFFGGVVGIIFGIAVSFIVSKAVQLFGYNWPFFISSTSVLVAVAVSISIGVIFGMYPARKASQISPMEALRYE